MFKTNENGRSMVEMLGVLAIIGVLSVAGIMGYTVAMRKHRANEIAEAISMLAIAAKTANGGTGITEKTGGYSYDELLDDNRTVPGIDHLTVKPIASGYEIELAADSEALCDAVAKIFGSNSNNPVYLSTDCSNAGVARFTAK